MRVCRKTSLSAGNGCAHRCLHAQSIWTSIFLGAHLGWLTAKSAPPGATGTSSVPPTRRGSDNSSPASQRTTTLLSYISCAAVVSISRKQEIRKPESPTSNQSKWSYLASVTKTQSAFHFTWRRRTTLLSHSAECSESA